MKKYIADVSVTENVSLVTLKQIDNSYGKLAAIFGAISEMGIVVDMISQSSPAKETVELSFIVSDADIPELMAFFAKNKEYKASIYSGNTKISFFGKEMEKNAGVAARVFEIFAKAECDIKMVTASTCDISCLISPEYTDRIVELYKAE